jgi:hypothetical protein
VVAGEHAPEPSQLRALVAVPPVQLALPHEVEEAGYVHAVRVDPLHDPPHALPSDAHAVLPPTGAPLTAWQVPIDPETLQASHWPPQPVSQQTPSIQFPDVHAEEDEHADPFGSPPPLEVVVTEIVGQSVENASRRFPACTLNVYVVDAASPVTTNECVLPSTVATTDPFSKISNCVMPPPPCAPDHVSVTEVDVTLDAVSNPSS